MIQRITRAYIRRYRDTGQIMAGVEWLDWQGKAGSTIANVRQHNGTLAECYGPHMGALLARAICHGVTIERESF